jgi:hydrogenase maturation protease
VDGTAVRPLGYHRLRPSVRIPRGTRRVTGGLVPDERITVMGIGNPLVKDEGVGIRIIEAMMSTLTFPDNVALVDAGTMGMGILNLFQDCDYLLVIDAVDGTGEAPGTVVRMTPEDMAPNTIKHSMHDMRLVDVLEAATLMGTRPDVDCIGIQVLDMDGISIGLTEPVESAVPRAVEAALSVLAEHGVVATPSTRSSDEGRVLSAIHDPGRRPIL